MSNDMGVKEFFCMNYVLHYVNTEQTKAKFKKKKYCLE